MTKLFQKLYSMGGNRQEYLVEHHNYNPVLLEKERIPVAQIPIKGDELHQSVLLHQRYVPRGVKHRKLNVRGFRRGRTLDVLLDEPIVINGTPQYLLNFKGVGADADEAMVIHPVKWYEKYPFDGKYWIPNTDEFERCFGAVKRTDAYAEFNDRTLQQHNIPFVEHITVNDIPRAVSERINTLAHAPGYKKFSQIVRAASTNVRMADVIDSPHNYKLNLSYMIASYIDAWELAEIDALVIKIQLALAKHGKCLDICGIVKDNRLVNGMFIDAENYVELADLEDVRHSGSVFLSSVLYSTYASSGRSQAYISRLLARTRLCPQHVTRFTGVSTVVDVVNAVFAQNIEEWKLKNEQCAKRKQKVTVS